MDRNTILTVIILGVIIALVMIIFADLNSGSIREEEIYGIHFISDSMKPTTHVQGLATNETFIISPSFTEISSSLNSKMTDVITRSNIVLLYTGRNSVVIARVFNEEEVMAGCYTNEGSYNEGKDISIEECNLLLGNPDSVILKVEMPSEEERVEVSGNTITIFPLQEDDISSITHSVLRLLFGKSADDAVEAANKISDDLSK